MFYHIVMMRLAGPSEADFDRQVEAYAQRIRAECGGLLRYDYCRNEAARSQGYAHVIAAIFDSSEAHDRYQVSPVHQALAAYVKPFVADILVFDSDLPHPAAVPGARGGVAPA
jgi:quinol monooxygenase YgiN